MRRSRTAAIGVLGATLLLAGGLRPSAESAIAVAFTLSSVPVRADGATVYELDRRDRLAAELGEGLPADPERALAEARRRLDAPEGRNLMRRLRKAGAGNALASRLGIDRLPAVVVDGSYVVYGVRDARRALDFVTAWRRENESSVKNGPGNARSLPHPDTGTPPARSLPWSGQR